MSLVAIHQFRCVEMPISDKRLRLVAPNLESKYGFCWYGDVDIFDDGVLYLNSFTKIGEIVDGTYETMMIGESSHPSKWGAGDGYGDGCEGGPATWWFGGATTRGSPFGLSVGRVLRSTKHPVNSNILCLADDQDNVGALVRSLKRELRLRLQMNHLRSRPQGPRCASKSQPVTACSPVGAVA